MKYLLVNIDVREGERIHSHHSLTTTKAENIQWAGLRHAMTFWGHWGVYRDNREFKHWWVHHELIASLHSVVELSKQEFDFLNEVLNGRRPIYHMETDQNGRVSRAGHYLCDSDLSVEEQLDIIDAYEGDDDRLLDYIHEDVIVWEPLEFRLTVKEFRQCVD